jgi:hypothetical protein
MTDIDYRDCHLTITIGTRTKMSIFGHMREFLFGEIKARGFDVRDPELFSMLTIEDRAFRLAEKIVSDVERYYLADNASIQFRDAGAAMRELPGRIDEFVAKTKKEFLDDQADGLRLLIQLASGTPVDFFGKSWDFRLGPDAERS